MPWADALYAHDLNWWKEYAKEVQATFAGDLATSVNWEGVERHPVPKYPNSGCGAISLAIYRGASRVILVGYDCQHTGGKTHHHGDHPRTLGNAGGVATWPEMFRTLALATEKAGIRVINASRTTALRVFERMPLEQALAEDAADQRTRSDPGMD